MTIDHPTLIDDPVLDGYDRGLPPASRGLRVSELGAQHWRLAEHLETPLATIRLDHLEHNARVMRAWCADRQAEIWPHAKTIMSPQLIRLQLDHGAPGVTAATETQARLLLDWGVPAVLIANQIVQPAAAKRIAERIASTSQRVMCYVDSPHGVQVLGAAAEAAGATMDVLLELGAPGVRSGVRTIGEGIEISTLVHAQPGLRLAGVAGYEGSFGADRSEAALTAVDAFLDTQLELLRDLHRRGLLGTDTPVFSAGGSMFFDRVADAHARLDIPARLVIRSGCYLLHDIGLFADATPLRETDDTPGLRAALSVWGTVHSRPEPTRAYLDIGRRDAGFDQGLPQPIRRLAHGQTTATEFHAARTVQLNDQHLHLELPADSPVQVGDRIEFGVSHPCTTMDKWRTIVLVDEAGAVLDAVSTRF